MPPPKPWRAWNDLAAYQFDNAILFGGLVIENALQERKPVGDPAKHETEPKYTLTQLLDPDFRLPRTGDGNEGRPGLKALAAAFPGEVGRWKQVA